MSAIGADFTPWPAQDAEAYRAAGYWEGRTLTAHVRDWCRTHGDRTALIDGERRWTYADLDSDLERAAAGFHRLGLRPGEKVVVQLPNTAEFVLTCLALLRVGARPVLALPAHRSHEIDHLCAFSGAVAYVIPAEHAGFDFRTLARSARAAAPDLRHVVVLGEPDPGDIAWSDLLTEDAPAAPELSVGADEVALYLLSGGTTGLPKLIPRTHDDYAYNVAASADVCGFGQDTVYLVALPAAHNFPFGCPGILGTLRGGGTVVLAPSPAPSEAFAIVERERVTTTALVPPLALLWTETARWAGRDLSSLRLLQVGGARLGEEVARRVFPTLGAQLQQVFGMAEGLLCYTRLDDPDEVVLATQGRPISPADEIRVLGVDGTEVAPGELGELLTRGPYTLRGYYCVPEHNARAFTADGFYRTGDLVRRTPEGNLVVEGRVKDVINRGGEKVSAEELENLLHAHPAVSAATVVGLPDTLLGERTCAVVVPRGQAPVLSELVAFLRQRGLADFKLPDRLEIRSELPQTGVGKVDKRRLVGELVPPRHS